MWYRILYWEVSTAKQSNRKLSIKPYKVPVGFPDKNQLKINP
jgi:hypothetical protein